ncbi:MAG: anaerobic ribonucleoside-triphosphate reductase [Anaerolineae bacterium]|jgi:anaerobic ribonucleoside-triphosphate reductase|nr:anaerobic ribonucleoside-triphosphate reductase [Anaerolineae bacterium]
MANRDQAEEKSEATEVRVPCEVYSRIVGYLRPVQAWNKGKQQEFAERRTFKVEESVDSGS